MWECLEGRGKGREMVEMPYKHSRRTNHFPFPPVYRHETKEHTMTEAKNDNAWGLSFSFTGGVQERARRCCYAMAGAAHAMEEYI